MEATMPEVEAVETAAGRVARGAAFLDAVWPGWARNVDGDRLAMESCTECVLGQVRGDYHVAIDDLGHDGCEDTWAEDYGFRLTDQQRKTVDGSVDPGVRAEGRRRMWDELADLWRAEVRRRAG
jgi:hypothetical protein